MVELSCIKPWVPCPKPQNQTNTERKEVRKYATQITKGVYLAITHQTGQSEAQLWRKQTLLVF